MVFSHWSSKHRFPINGYTIFSTFTPCVPDGHYTQLHERTLERSETKSKWQIAQRSTQVSHAHLSASVDLPPDASALYGLTYQLRFEFPKLHGHASSAWVHDRKQQWTNGEWIYSKRKANSKRCHRKCKRIQSSHNFLTDGR